MSPSAQLVTAWQALADMLPIAKGSGLVVDWDQTSSLMYTSGDVRIVRIWDTETELRVQVWLVVVRSDTVVPLKGTALGSNNLCRILKNSLSEHMEEEDRWGTG